MAPISALAFASRIGEPIADVARAQGVSLQTVDVHNPTEISPAFDSLRDGGVDGVNILSSPLFSGFVNSSAGCSSRTSLRRYASGGKWPLSGVWRAMARRTASSRR